MTLDEDIVSISPMTAHSAQVRQVPDSRDDLYGDGAHLLHSCINRIAQDHPRPGVVVAIPVCNEIERIDRCIEALANQRDTFGLRLPHGMVRVLLLANGCTDGTYQFIEKNKNRWRVALCAYEVVLPEQQRNAGCARRVANMLATRLMSEGNGLLFMTDADSVAPPKWVATYSALLHSGYDAVAGLVDLHPDDCGDISPALCERGALEDRFTVLLDQLDSIVDPISHDGWPRHYNASGANTAVRLDALAGTNDFPAIACGEDRLFVRMLEARGRRIRHDRETRVFTSGRLVGRAAGGMADTLRYRLNDPEAPCDSRLETTESAYARACLRNQLRSDFVQGRVITKEKRLLGPLVGLAEGALNGLERYATFEELWQHLEAQSPLLKRRAIAPRQLAFEIKRAEYLVGSLIAGRDEPQGPEMFGMTA